MSVNISIMTNGFDSIANILGGDKYDKAVAKAHKRLVLYAMTRIAVRARQDVYSYEPKDPLAYRRTGKLLGGSGGLNSGMPYKKEISNNTTFVEANPKYKGAKFNYAPWVNAGKGHMKKVGERPFFDNALKEINSTGVQKAKEILEKNTKL